MSYRRNGKHRRNKHHNKNTSNKDWVYRIDERIKGSSPSHCTVVPKGREPVERMIKRFNKKVKRSGVLEEIRDRRFYEKPSKIKRLKKQRAKRLARKAQREYEARFKD